MFACLHGREEAVKVLLQDPRVLINATDKRGNTAITKAGYNRRIVALLQQHGGH